MSASQKWWLLLGALIILGLIFRIYSLIAFVVMLAAIITIARWWQTHSLDEVTYTRHFKYDRGFPGENLEMQVIVENRKFLPLPWLRVMDPLPKLIGPEDELLLQPGLTTEQGFLNNVFSLRWYERDRRFYKLLLRKRGVFRLGPAELESGDLFGLFEQIGERGGLDYLTVFPKPSSIKALGLPVADPFGDQYAKRRLFEDPGQPMGVREYHPEDDFRRMHWPATARTGQLKVKVYQPVSARVLILCLNISTLDNVWEGTIPELLEHLVSVTAALAQRALIDGYQVGLVSNGALAHADQPFRILPGRSPAQLTHLLTALAGVTPFVTGSFDRFLMAEAPRLPLGATLLMITAIYPPGWDETLIKLKQHGRKITILSFASKPPRMIPGIEMIHRPYF